MIELIFVIVILGILTAIAIPKFATNKGIAELNSIRSSVNIIIKSSAGFILKDGTIDFSTLGLDNKWIISTANGGINDRIRYTTSEINCQIDLNSTNGILVDINCPKGACTNSQYDINYTF